MTLSGRVDGLENQMSFVIQDLLSKLDLNTVSQLNNIWNQKLDIFENKLEDTDDSVSILQNLYSSLYNNIFSGATLSGSYISESFETINKNLKQYNYSMSYSTGNYLTGIRYSIGGTSFVNKKLEYNLSGLLTGIELSGNPLPSTSLHKYFLYSGETLTGVTYS